MGYGILIIMRVWGVQRHETYEVPDDTANN